MDNMLQLIAVIQKELLLLVRDRAGLLVLFVMPAVLVVVITLVQENALKAIGESQTRILLIDGDGQTLGRQIADALKDTHGVLVIEALDGRTPDRQQALGLVARGAYPLCLIIPSGLTGAVQNRARQSALESLSAEGAGGAMAPPPVIEVYFDPTVLGGFRSAVRHLLDLMTLRLEVNEKMAALARILPERINRSITAALEPVAGLNVPPPQMDLQLKWSDLPLLRVEDGGALGEMRAVLPTSVQQNVPAWCLFGIFFIVLPMAGAFIQERINGTHQRLLAMPVAYLTLASGRILAYMGICLVQCTLIGCIGKWVLPLWGTPPLEMGGTPLALLVMIASAILAATGYGTLLGTVVDSYEQASMFGPISIVIAAAIGGIMVPVYAMPEFMQTISVISPLAWGLNGALDVFVRGGNLVDVLPEAGALSAFFAACICIAWLWQSRRRWRGNFGWPA
ncbi:ABC transporter permease [Desulfosarcina sp.]|uniref:ABC transporter permease n=1 Tax=Desulfosarcina sp. TaxID=2027861 RepID=UPI003970BD2F